MATSSTAPRHVPESSVLIPTTEASNGDWPTFVLSDAVVYRPDGVTMANALLINQEGPFTIRGRLEIDDDNDLKYLVNPSIRKAHIEIQDCKVYSIGYDPEAVIWLGGKAGWFELNPHPCYAQIYKDMCQVSHLDYVLAKIYGDELTVLKSDHRKAPASMDIKEVLFQYAVALGDGITYEETIDKCVRLGPVLVAHMESSTGLFWKQTSIYTWLVREIKNKERTRRSSSRDASQPLPAAPVPASVYAPLRETPVPVPVIPPPTAQSLQARPMSQQLPFRAWPASGQAAAAAPAGEPPAPPPAAARTASAPQTTVASTVPVPDTARSMTTSMSKEETEAVFQLVLQVVEDIGRRDGNQAGLTAGKVHATLHQQYKLKEYNTGKLLSAFFARRLLESLDGAWDGGPYVKYLERGEGNAWLPTSDSVLRTIPSQLVRRNAAPTRASSYASAPASASLLGPSQPGTPASQQIPQTAGKRPVLRPPAAASKRPFDSAFGSGGGSEPGHLATSAQNTPRGVGRPRKVAKNAHDGLAAAAPSAIPSAAPAAAPVDPDPDLDLDSSDSDDSSEGSDLEGEDETTVVAVHAVPLTISTRPTGPNGTWNCPHPGCRFLVRNAGAPERADRDSGSDSSGRASRESIHAHLRSHEEKALSRVDLAITEGSRRHVSVDNLLAKIRALADRKGDQGRPDGSPRPAATAGVGTSSSTLRRFLF